MCNVVGGTGQAGTVLNAGGRNMSPKRSAILAVCVALLVSACADHAKLSVAAGSGPSPQLPPQKTKFLPTLKIAPARGWPSDKAPIAGKSMNVTAIARGLEHPRWLYVLPNDDILVAETNAPPKPEDSKGLKGWVTKLVMKRAGAVTPSANRISLLRRHPGRQTYDRFILLEGLNSPFGMALLGDQLYVADSDALMRFAFRVGQTRINSPGVKVVDLPAGPINHHWTKNVISSADGRTLFVSVGSNSNVGENGMAAEAGRAAIWAVDPRTGHHRIFASGLRNPVGMGIEPHTGALWVAVNERDELGSDLVPDYMTRVHEGAFYGWPYSYYGQHVDPRPQPPRPYLVAKAIPPDYALGPHTASLGLAFSHHGAFIGQHGSWNRNPPSGYKVIFVPFKEGRPYGLPRDVLTGFRDEQGNAYGRPVGVALDRKGGLLVADDVGNTIWRISPGLPAN